MTLATAAILGAIILSLVSAFAVWIEPKIDAWMGISKLPKNIKRIDYPPSHIKLVEATELAWNTSFVISEGTPLFIEHYHGEIAENLVTSSIPWYSALEELQKQQKKELTVDEAFAQLAEAISRQNAMKTEIKAVTISEPSKLVAQHQEI